MLAKKQTKKKKKTTSPAVYVPHIEKFRNVSNYTVQVYQAIKRFS